MPHIIDLLTTILTFIILISNFVVMLLMWIDKAKAPEKSQDERISTLEKRVDDLYDRLLAETDRVKDLEENNVITLQSLLALMRHATDGNHVSELNDASTALDKYLTHKGKKE